jgi:hypothetical protein
MITALFSESEQELTFITGEDTNTSHGEMLRKSSDALSEYWNIQGSFKSS